MLTTKLRSQGGIHMGKKIKKNSSQLQGSNKNQPERRFHFSYEITLSDVINVIMALLTLISVIGVFKTISEMKKDREAAYMPAVLMNPTEYTISWDSAGNEPWLEFDSTQNNLTSGTAEDGSYSASFTIPMQLFTDNGIEKLSLVNAGVGTARDLVLSWDSNNTQRLIDYLVQYNPEKVSFCHAGKSVSFEFDSGIVITDVEKDTCLTYLLPNASETYSIAFPMHYSLLIHEIIKCNNFGETPPTLFLHATYSDVHGNNTHDIFCITVKKLEFMQDPSGAGHATYQLIPLLPSS